MKKLCSLLLCLCLAFSAAAPSAVGEDAGPSVGPVTETIRPGKAILLSFTLPADGAVSLRLVDDNGQVVITVVEHLDAVAGTNALWWNGTNEGVFAPEGPWRLRLDSASGTAETPVTVGPVAPYLTNIMSLTSPGDSVMTIQFYANMDGQLSVGAVSESGAWSLADSLTIAAGENAYRWDMAAHPGVCEVTLTLTDAEGYPSTEEHIVVAAPEAAEAPTETPTEAPTEVPSEAPSEIPTEVPTEVPADETASEAPEEALVLESLDLSDNEASEETLILEDAVYTPAHGSPYEDLDASLSYWNMPMDITDEEAVWNVLTQPITVIYSSKDRADRTQVVIREQPDEDSRGVGVVTRNNQGIHVLETLDNGWALIECYSSSFYDSAVKNWNALVQGYVKTDQFKVIEPRQDMGIVIDKLTQRLYLFVEGHLYATLLVSTGLTNEKQPYNETRSGEFLLTSRVGAFKDGNLTFEMAVRFNSGDLLHEIPHYTNSDGSRRYGYGLKELGTKASHGCIRVQRYRTPEGVNMSWLWEHLKTKNTKLLIWEDWQGRQIAYPADDLALYYNPSGGEMYHSQATCYSAVDKTFVPFTYAELDTAPYASLTRCPYCTPVLRRAEIDAINAVYAPGGDHDPVLTEARQKYLDGLEDER